MNTDINFVNAHYQSIPAAQDSGFSFNHEENKKMYHNFNLVGLFRGLKTFAVTALVVAISMIVTRKLSVSLHSNHFRKFRMASKLSESFNFDSHRHFDNRQYMKPFRVLNSISGLRVRSNQPPVDITTLGSQGNLKPFPDMFVRKERSCSKVPDFVLDERVLTGQCSQRSLCRARILVHKEKGQVVIKAGYYIYTVDGKHRTVDSETISKIGNTSSKKVLSWAKSLIAGLGTKLDDVNCPVTVEMIVQSITDSMKSVVACPRTGDPLCEALLPVKKCTCSSFTGGTEEENACLEFIRSNPDIQSLADLHEGCHNAVFIYQRVNVSLPICETTCASNPMIKHRVFMEFWVQSDTRVEHVEDCISAALIPAYNTLYSSIPSCDDIQGEVMYGPSFLYLVAGSYEGNIPEKAVQIAKNHGCALTFVFFEEKGFDSFQDIVDESCNLSL